MQIGFIIKNLRKEKDITQEQLAEYLGISSRAISQWETGKTMPDISQLPILANLFEVTTDYLLGVNINEKDKKVNDIVETAQKHWSRGLNDKGAEILREGLKSYPDNPKIMLDLMSCLWRVRNFPENKENRDALTQEVIDLGEKILETCTDTEIRNSATQLLCFIYPDTNHIDKATKLANTMPNRYVTREQLLKRIYKGTKRFELVRDDLCALISDLCHDMLYNCAPLDDGNRPYTAKERVAIHKKYLDIMNIFFEDGNYGFFREMFALANLNTAFCCISVDDCTQAISYLNTAKEQAIIYDTKYNPDDEYTCILLNGMKFGGVLRNTNKNVCKRLVEEMQDSAFDKIRNNDDFISILNELKKYADNY
ncbi:MAG: helix-turn-helix transcriptional regulator [Clostridia bacterium]|nr:helix-turn-helix transcriptional regulator [Clostridia bacterium]